MQRYTNYETSTIKHYRESGMLAEEYVNRYLVNTAFDNTQILLCKRKSISNDAWCELYTSNKYKRGILQNMWSKYTYRFRINGRWERPHILFNKK